MKVDRAAVERMTKERTAQATAERIAFLYSRLFGNVAPGRDVEDLRTENEAREMFTTALGSADNLRQVEILRVAVDNRWANVVNAFIKAWDGEHPISAAAQELWNLTTTGRASA
ncbi:MAG: hypothetical protein VX424_12755 [Actinomycetota bacterium]|nr:hypothetical protein [Actinomycetota bacterium]